MNEKTINTLVVSHSNLSLHLDPNRSHCDLSASRFCLFQPSSAKRLRSRRKTFPYHYPPCRDLCSPDPRTLLCAARWRCRSCKYTLLARVAKRHRNAVEGRTPVMQDQRMQIAQNPVSRTSSPEYISLKRLGVAEVTSTGKSSIAEAKSVEMSSRVPRAMSGPGRPARTSMLLLLLS